MTSANAGKDTNILHRQDLAMAVNAFLASVKSAQPGEENTGASVKKQVKWIQQRYWPLLDEILLAALRRRRGALELTDDERLFVDLGVVDARMVGGAEQAARTTKTLLAEVRGKGQSNCYYLSEWLNYRQQQTQLESDLDWADRSTEQNDYTTQLGEARRRAFSRLSKYLTGIPGVTKELSDMAKSGELDRAVIASGIAAMKSPVRKNLLRRHRLWSIREQILAKARARADNQAVLRLFELVNEIYLREWQTRHESMLFDESAKESSTTAKRSADTRMLTAIDSDSDTVMRETRRMRMRMRLLEALDGRDDTETILYGTSPRIDKTVLASLMPIVQTFDRELADPPPVVIIPGMGRGMYVWENGCLMLALRPLVGADDSLATAFAWMRMLTDRFNNRSALRKHYLTAFPGANFQDDFPADYRAWMCRMTKGDISAMSPEKRLFFYDHIGPVLSGPLLPPNLRDVGPQTMSAIARRLEKQVVSENGDAKLHRRLATIYWQQGVMEAAGTQFNAAIQSAPDDGETLFIAGMFMRSQGEHEAANECFRAGADGAMDSLWGIYCQDALKGIF